LAGKIVADFHSVEAAAKAAEDWAKQFQKDELPEALEEVRVSIAKIRSTATVRVADALPDGNEGGNVQPVTSDISDAEIFRVDKLIKEAGLAASTTEAGRKIKEKAVSINGQLITGLAVLASSTKPLKVRVGKRAKNVVLVNS